MCVPFIVSTKNDMGCGFFSSRIANEWQWHILLWLFWMLFIFQVGDLEYYSCRFPSCAIYFVVVPFSIRFAWSSFRFHLIQSRNDNRSFKLLSTALNPLTRHIIRLQINNTTTTVMTAIINISFFHVFISFSISFSCVFRVSTFDEGFVHPSICARTRCVHNGE